MRCALVIPTRNAGAHLDRLLPALAAQRRQPDSILVVDSRSSDDTVERFRAFGARVEVIEPASFNHGGTRRWASQQVEADALIYLTQDAIPASPDSFANLLDELYAEADIGVAYGRQLPHPGAGLLGAQARRFNYPPESRSKRLADASELGIKTCFSSDSFSAYRSDALAAVGGFPEDVIGSEDLLEALADLFASAPEMRQRVRLTLAGGTAAEMAFGAGGNYLDQLKAQIAELGLADAIDWNLNLAAADIPRTIQAHHVMVLPYRESKKLGLLGQQRGTSGALSWAAACGRGAITSDARAFAEEVASGNGAIYPQGDVAALSEQLLNLAREPRLAQAWAERAGAIGHARTWPRTALRFQALFNDMVGTVHGT